jgi:RNA recognition motif-containing protein
MDARTKHTIYLKNLNDSVSKGELRQSLYELATVYGSVVEIVATKTEKMRGQAFLVFHDVAAAAKALQGLNGFVLYGRPITAQYAEKPSTAIATAAE